MDRKEKERELQRIISLTFDEKPSVRKEAALKLAQSDDPAAIFALLELSYDKDESVKATAREILSKKQPTDKDAISFAEIFTKGAEPEELVKPPTPKEDAKKKKLLSPVEQIFERKLGKERAALVKDRMMPTIEKIYLKAVESKPGESEKREKSMQKMLTSYADILSGLDKLMFEDRQEREAQAVPVQTIEEAPKPPEAETAAKEPEEPPVLEVVASQVDVSKISRDLADISEGEEEAEIRREACPEAEEGIEKSIFRKAYDLMMATDGDEEIMFQQSQKLIKRLQEDVNLAFKIAKQRFKAANITHLTELKNGMRNVHTDTLTVKSVQFGEYSRTKTKKDTYTRIVVNDDEGSEGIIYMFEGRGKEVQPGMKVKVVKGQVKAFAFSGETAITVGRKGSVYIVL